MFSYWIAWIRLSQSVVASWCSPTILMMACWWSSCILFVSCGWTCGSNTLQQYLLKSFAFGYWLENNSSYIPSSLTYRSNVSKSLGELTVVLTIDMATNWCLCQMILLLQLLPFHMAVHFLSTSSRLTIDSHNI